MNRSAATAFMESLATMLRPIDGRPAVLDEELAPLLGIRLFRLREVITRNIQCIPEGEIFRTTLRRPRQWALTELGALLVTSGVATPQAAAISVGIVREVCAGWRGPGGPCS